MKRGMRGCVGLALALVLMTTAALGADWPQFLGESGSQGVSDGVFATGTYGRNGVYACFTAEDEDPTRSDEVKQAIWKVESGSPYGFSFNGAAFVAGKCYFGCGSTLYVVDRQTGEARTFDIGAGYSIRSTITYSGETGRLYVAANHPTEGAAVFSYALNADGMPDRASALEWVSHTAGGGTQSTPVVYRGRLYLGGGGGMMGSAEPFHVIDAATMEECYSAPIQTKGSAALTTAYATEENGETVYLYLVPYAPKDGTTAQLWILTDCQGQTEAQYQAVDGVGRGQYCSQSVAVAQDGALLWFNDAGRLYCYENLAALGAGVFWDTCTHWAREQIAALAQKDLLCGVGGGNFAPDAPMTRAQFVQVLARLTGEELPPCTASPFDDVRPDDWFAPAVAQTAEQPEVHTCTLAIRCDTATDRSKVEREAVIPYIPADGVILAETEVTFTPGESVFDVLLRVTREKEIQMEFREDALYSGAYVEGIHYLYEFDCGPLSGWMYRVNGRFPNYGCGQNPVRDGDAIVWLYTCDLGQDVGESAPW